MKSNVNSRNATSTKCPTISVLCAVTNSRFAAYSEFPPAATQSAVSRSAQHFSTSFPIALFFYLRAKLENFAAARTLPGDQLAMLRLCTSGGYIRNCLSLANILSSIIVGSSVLHHQ
jgi:hypothetical protein